jgi:hypothetical protein
MQVTSQNAVLRIGITLTGRIWIPIKVISWIRILIPINMQITSQNAGLLIRITFTDLSPWCRSGSCILLDADPDADHASWFLFDADVDSEPTFHFDTELDADPAFLCRSESGPSDNSIDLKKK